MGRSRVFWAIGTVAPWCLGAGLAVSFPAGAGEDAAIGGNIAALTSTRAARPGDIVPATSLPFIAPPGGLGIGYHTLMHHARLVTGNEEEAFETAPDEHEPRIVLKKPGRKFPRPDRSGRSDPFIGLRPTFDAKLRKPGSLKQYIASQQIYSGDVLAFRGFQRAVAVQEANKKPASAAEAMQPSATPSSTSHTTRGKSDLVAMPARRHLDGSSLRVPRAIALSSATPVSAGDNVRIVSAPMLLHGAVGGAGTGKQPADQTEIARSVKKPNYAMMIARASQPAQRKCLAEAIYFESRSESEAGQAAVAQVVLNRTLSPLYPNSVCGVVYQNRHRYKACQFSFACEGKSLRIHDHNSWASAVRIAKEVLEGRTYLAKVGGSTHYHATYVRPRWAKRLKRMNKIGTHIFYKLKPGQT